MLLRAKMLLAAENIRWENCNPIFKKLLVTGEKASGPLMRKFAAGKWIYRRMTAAEESEYMADTAW